MTDVEMNIPEISSPKRELHNDVTKIDNFAGNDVLMSKPRKLDQRVIINVGGSRHETVTSTLDRLPGTRLALLAHLLEADDSYDQNTREFFFDRNPQAFGVVIQYHRTNELHVDHNLCGNVLKAEFEFWGIEDNEVEACCWANYSKFIDHRETLRELDDNFAFIEEDVWSGRSKARRCANTVWRFLEDPSSSVFAKVYAVISMFFVALSIVIFVLETHKLFQIDENSGIRMDILEPADVIEGVRQVEVCGCCATDTANVTKPTYHPIAHPVIQSLDYICVVFFTVEFLARLIFAPDKVKFWKGALNVIDLICLIPHYVAIILVAVDLTSAAVPLKTFMMLRIVRILRIFKLMKHYSAFKILAYTVKVSTKELLLMIVFLMSGVLMFASVIHYADRNNFPNIPIGIWWALVTMTTVGYGDKYPRTYVGYGVGSLCVVCGVLVIAFTVPIVVNNFSLYYSHAQTRIKLPPKKTRSGRSARNLKTEVTSVSSNNNLLKSVQLIKEHVQMARMSKEVTNQDKAQWATPRKTGHGRVGATPGEERNNDTSDVLVKKTSNPGMTTGKIQEETDKVMNAYIDVDRKFDNERKRQEFLLKMKRERRLKDRDKERSGQSPVFDTNTSEDI